MLISFILILGFETLPREVTLKKINKNIAY